MGKDKKSHSKTKMNHQSLIDFDQVLKLGGQKKDLELLTGLSTADDEEEAIDWAEDMEAEPIHKDEIRDFIKSLKFDDVMEVTEVTAGEKKSVTEGEVTQEAGAEHIAGSAGSTGKSKPKDKKHKNKFKIQDENISSTSSTLDLEFIQDYNPRKHLLVKAGGKWFDHKFSTEKIPSQDLPKAKVQLILDHVAKIYSDELNIYKKQQETSKKSNITWTRTVLTSGTLSDKMAALTLLVQEDPVHNLPSLDQILAVVKKKGRREALMAMETLKELFLSELLPDDRKLKSFDQNPLTEAEGLASGNKDSRDKRLLLWFYEAQLRDKYSEFIQALETLCRDNVSAAKQKALGVVLELLCGKPEQEKKLLTILINKLGDPDYKVASRACYLLSKLVETHPRMKTVLVGEVERLLYRPNVAHKAQYYAVCFLNQFILDKNDSSLAVKLINIYFSFFKAFVKKGEVDSKMLSALLTGVNRAYPFAEDQSKIDEQMDTLYKIVHIVNFNTSLQALMLLYQVMDSSARTSDRYYQALYRKMLDPGLQTSAKQNMFLNLLFKSIKKDSVERRVKAFIKRLLQICCGLQTPFICGSLVLLSEVLKVKPSLLQFSQVSEDSEDEEEHFVDIKLEDENDEGEDGEDTASAEDLRLKETKQLEDVKNALGHKGHVTVPSWVHRQNTGAGHSRSTGYEPLHRNPLHARAESECVWELDKLANHFHPSVALFAKTILKGQSVEYPGDPMDDFTLIRFLDRFVFRNPKKREKSGEEGNVKSVLQHKSRGRTDQGAKSVAINSEEFLQMDESSIPVDEKFFHRYFLKRSKMAGSKVEVDSDVDDNEFDEFLDQYEKGFDGADLDLDFSGDFSKNSKKTKKKKTAQDEESEDEDEDGDDDLSDEEIDFSDEDMEGEFDDDLIDEEDVAFSDDEDEFEGFGDGKKVKKRKAADDDDFFLDGPPSLPRKREKKPKEFDTSSLFAAAEEFSHLMDETTSSKINSTGTEALSNKDNAGVKQLKWELERDRWMKGDDWKSRKHQQHHKKGGHKNRAGTKNRAGAKGKPSKGNKGKRQKKGR